MGCRTHSRAPDEGHCPICLLEAALATPRDASDGWGWAADDGATDAVRRVTVQVPLGATSAGAVYLVRQHAPVGALLRLKTWRALAPADFLDRVGRLQQDLARVAEPALIAPLAAFVDANGRPSVLSDFRQGVPLPEAARSGELTTDAALAFVRSLRDLLGRLHAVGLAHGSLVPGNVIVHSGAWFLVDFGTSGLLGPTPDVTELMKRDLQGLSALAVTSLPGS
jgi:serine/threonine protein kinase